MGEKDRMTSPNGPRGYPNAPPTPTSTKAPHTYPPAFDDVITPASEEAPIIGPPRYPSSVSVLSSTGSPSRPNLPPGGGGGTTAGRYSSYAHPGPVAHPLSNAVYADSTPTLGDSPLGSSFSVVKDEKLGSYGKPLAWRNQVSADPRNSSPQRRWTGEPLSVDILRDERHFKLHKRVYLDGLKFLAAWVVLNGTFFDAVNLTSSDYPAIQRQSPLYILRSYSLGFSTLLVLSGRCVVENLWSVPTNSQPTKGQLDPSSGPSVSWPRLSRAMLIRPFRYILPVLVITALQWGLGATGKTHNCNAVGMDEPIWDQIRSFAGYATLVFDLFTYFEFETTAGQAFSGNLWTTPWFFQSNYCAYVVHLMLGNLSSNRYWIYGVLAFFSWCTFTYFYLAIIGLTVTDLVVHGAFARVHKWPLFSRLVLYLTLVVIACLTQFVGLVRNNINSGMEHIQVQGHTEIQFCDSIFIACLLVGLESSLMLQKILGNFVFKWLSKLTVGLTLLAPVISYTIVPDLALSMHNKGSSSSSILGVSWLVLFITCFALAIPFHLLVELPSKFAGEWFGDFIETWGSPEGTSLHSLRARDAVNAPRGKSIS